MSGTKMNIKQSIRQFILENFLFTDDEAKLEDDISLFDRGIVNSTGVLEIVSYIEEQWSFKVDDLELVPENFDSVLKICAYIERKLKE